MSDPISFPTRVGTPLYQAGDEISVLPDGEPKVGARGEEARWKGLPADSKLACSFYAFGKIWFPKKGVVQKLHEVLSDPSQHPKLLSGVDASKNLQVLKSLDPGILFHVYNLQASEVFQYVTEMTARDVGHGIVYVQRGLEEIDAWVMPEDFFEGKRKDLLKEYLGQIQILEIANGTVIVMEFSARIAGIEAPNCSWAADSSVGDGDLFAFSLSNRAIRQRIESRLEKMYHFAMRKQ